MNAVQTVQPVTVEESPFTTIPECLGDVKDITLTSIISFVLDELREQYPNLLGPEKDELWNHLVSLLDPADSAEDSVDPLILDFLRGKTKEGKKFDPAIRVRMMLAVLVGQLYDSCCEDLPGWLNFSWQLNRFVDLGWQGRGWNMPNGACHPLRTIPFKFYCRVAALVEAVRFAGGRAGHGDVVENAGDALKTGLGRKLAEGCFDDFSCVVYYRGSDIYHFPRILNSRNVGGFLLKALAIAQKNDDPELLWHCMINGDTPGPEMRRVIMPIPIESVQNSAARCIRFLLDKGFLNDVEQWRVVYYWLRGEVHQGIRQKVALCVAKCSYGDDERWNDCLLQKFQEDNVQCDWFPKWQEEHGVRIAHFLSEKKRKEEKARVASEENDRLAQELTEKRRDELNLLLGQIFQ